MKRTRLQCLNLFLYIFGPFNPLPDFLFIAKTGLTGECFVQANLEIVIAKGIIFTQIQKLCKIRDFGLAAVFSDLKKSSCQEHFEITFIDVDYLLTQNWVGHFTKWIISLSLAAEWHM